MPLIYMPPTGSLRPYPLRKRDMIREEYAHHEAMNLRKTPRLGACSHCTPFVPRCTTCDQIGFSRGTQKPPLGMRLAVSSWTQSCQGPIPLVVLTISCSIFYPQLANVFDTSSNFDGQQINRPPRLVIG